MEDKPLLSIGEGAGEIFSCTILGRRRRSEEAENQCTIENTRKERSRQPQSLLV